MAGRQGQPVNQGSEAGPAAETTGSRGAPVDRSQTLLDGGVLFIPDVMLNQLLRANAFGDLTDVLKEFAHGGGILPLRVRAALHCTTQQHQGHEQEENQRRCIAGREIHDDGEEERKCRHEPR